MYCNEYQHAAIKRTRSPPKIAISRPRVVAAAVTRAAAITAVSVTIIAAVTTANGVAAIAAINGIAAVAVVGITTIVGAGRECASDHSASGQGTPRRTAPATVAPTSTAPSAAPSSTPAADPAHRRDVVGQHGFDRPDIG